MKFGKALYISIVFFILTNAILKAQFNWMEQESTNFKIIYLESSSHLVDHILLSAEKSLIPLAEMFDYSPSEKIIINIHDLNDFGLGTASTVPQNIIRLSIEQFESGYENTLYTERFNWLISHELVHIVFNDQSTDLESFSRKLFSKVPPDQSQPSTVLFSLLSNPNRYTPRWYQEGLAVYYETWFNGGFGRTLSSFDEMYFRTLVLEEGEFPEKINLETTFVHNSFLLETLYYFIGTRFVSYLSITYGPEKLLAWYKSDSGDMYVGIFEKFEDVFGVSYKEGWKSFIEYEKAFQKKNLEKLEEYKTTSVRHLTSEALGWVTNSYLDKSKSRLLFGSHKAHQLANLVSLNKATGELEEIGTIPTPSIYQVSSTAYDKSLGLLFFTTNNNRLYRDIWVLDTEAEEKKLLFENYRVGDLTVSDSTHELWGIEHSNGFSSLVYSPYPYNQMLPLIRFNLGEEVSHLSVSSSGLFLAAVLHRTSGEQSLIVFSRNTLLSDLKNDYITISNEGAPESPSWSPDENYLYWNGFNNGVSNIYRKDFNSGKIEALSHTLRGFFKPTHLSNDSLIVFEYTTDGFIPSIIPNKPAEHLPAIKYLGQEVFKKNPELADWNNNTKISIEEVKTKEETSYNSFSNIEVYSVIPMISGFQSQLVFGLFGHFSDPMFIHDLKVEAGFSPFNTNPASPNYHFKAKYNYNNKINFAFELNAPDFYDLFNRRKRGMIGRKFTLGHSKYWKYDYPHKIKQHSEITFYNGVQYINDNLVRVSQPDFMVAQTNVNSTNLRRTIGSSDYENGNMFDVTLRIFGHNPKSPEFAGQITFEWDKFNNWITPHNTLHLKLAAGYHHDNPDLVQARFYFGGFGNRLVENVGVKQFRKVFRFPGVPIYSMDADRFLKIMFENNLPPLRFSNASLGNHFFNHIDLSVFSNAMINNSPLGTTWLNVGAQANLVMKHWFNLESTFSAGIAKAWWDKGTSWEWLLSIKLLKN